jgi:hypothetical protein
MSMSGRLRWLAAGALLVFVIELIIVLAARVDVSTRPPAPPEQAGLPFPWGAEEVDAAQAAPDAEFERSLEESFAQESAAEFDADGDGVRTYPILALSGGGANGAFGAGFLCGWSAAGTRPDFKVVTGVSTGSLQATLAFVGSQYDAQLAAIYQHPTPEIYRSRGVLAGLFNDAINDMSPLADLIAHYATPEVLAAIAEKHRRGYRLYVGTTNMDTQEFVIWDMGRIAASDRPDAAERFRSVLLASCSVPVMFPPVYFKLEHAGNTYHEMHVDGSTYAQVFLRGFLLDLDDALEDVGITSDNARIILYVIKNGNLAPGEFRQTVAPRTVSIATATIEGLFRLAMEAALYRMYVLAHRYGIEFNLAFLPLEVGRELDPVDFAPEGTRRLFDAGYGLASDGYAWHRHPPGLDPDELYTETGAPAAEGDE